MIFSNMPVNPNALHTGGLWWDHLDLAQVYTSIRSERQVKHRKRPANASIIFPSK